MDTKLDIIFYTFYNGQVLARFLIGYPTSIVKAPCAGGFCVIHR